MKFLGFPRVLRAGIRAGRPLGLVGLAAKRETGTGAEPVRPAPNPDAYSQMPRESPPLPDERIYRTILLVLVVSLLIGAVCALAGDLLWHNAALSQAGTWLVIASGLAYAFFRVLGVREARKRADERADRSEDAFDDDDGEAP